MSADRRTYLCSVCGRFLFHARGAMAPVAIEQPCRDKRCGAANTVWLDQQPQPVTAAQNHIRQMQNHARGSPGMPAASGRATLAT